MRVRSKGNGKNPAGMSVDREESAIAGRRPRLQRKAKDRVYAERLAARQALGNATQRERNQANKTRERPEHDAKQHRKRGREGAPDVDSVAKKTPRGAVVTAEQAAAPLNIKYEIGTRVYKIFKDDDLDNDRPFSGRVVGYDVAERLYRVTYEDGDQEELDEGEMGRIFIYKSAALAASGRAPDSGSGSDDGARSRGFDIDAADADDPLAVSRYAADIHAHHRETEARLAVRPGYLAARQPSLDAAHRARLVDRLVAAHRRLRLVPETLYLAVHVVDRYLERVEVARGELPLVGAAALLIASKYEEIYPPLLRDLLGLGAPAGSYGAPDLLAAEEAVLRALDHRLTVPSARCFLVRYLKACRADPRIVPLSHCVLEGTLGSYALLRYRPSQLAAAAVYVARRSLGHRAWSPTLARCAVYGAREVLPVARAVLAARAAAPGECRAVRDKYDQARYGCIARIELCSGI